MRRHGAGEIALRSKAQPVLMDDTGAVSYCDSAGLVGTATVDDDFFCGNGHTVQATADAVGFVVGHDKQCQGQRCHRVTGLGGIVSGESGWHSAS